MECHVCHAKPGEDHKAYCSVSPGVMVVELWCQICGKTIEESFTKVGYYCESCARCVNDWGKNGIR